MPLSLLFDNTESIESRAREAVRSVVKSQERFPKWPNQDIAYIPASCYTCDERFWHPMDNPPGECPKCSALTVKRREIEAKKEQLEVEKLQREADALDAELARL